MCDSDEAGVLEVERLVHRGAGGLDGPGDHGRGGHDAEQRHDRLRKHEHLHRQAEELVAHRGGARGDAVDRHQVDGKVGSQVARAGRLPVGRGPVVHACNAVALPHVVKPLQVEKGRRDHPRPGGHRHAKCDQRDPDEQVHGEYAIATQALGVEGETRVGRHHVVIPEQPQVGDEQKRIQARIRGHHQSGRQPGENGREQQRGVELATSDIGSRRCNVRDCRAPKGSVEVQGHNRAGISVQGPCFDANDEAA